MEYIFLDESGDLGFNFNKSKTSEFFVITLLFGADKKHLEKIVKSTHSKLKRVHKKKGGILHCYKETPVTRLRLLNSLSDSNYKVMTIYLNKKKVFIKLQNEKDILYNYVTNILLDRIFTKKLVNPKSEIILIASRKDTNKFLNNNFKNYLKSKILNNHKINLNIEIKTPYEEKGLQAVDFVSWSFFRKYQFHDESYYNIFKGIVVEENTLFK